MKLSQKIKDSLRLRFRKSSVQATPPFASESAPTKEIERVKFPAIKNSMVRCYGERENALRYEYQFYSRFL